MDGARFANAVARAQLPPAEMTWRAGVDVLCFGGTKNGLPSARRWCSSTASWPRICLARQAGGAARVEDALRLGAVGGLLDDDVWLKHARHANAMAKRLHERIQALPGVKHHVPGRGQRRVRRDPAQAQAACATRAGGSTPSSAHGGCRLMCAWDTTPETVDRFAADLTAALARSS